MISKIFDIKMSLIVKSLTTSENVLYVKLSATWIFRPRNASLSPTEAASCGHKMAVVLKRNVYTHVHTRTNKIIFGILNDNKSRVKTTVSSQLFLIHSSRNFSLHICISGVLYVFCFVSFHELIKADYTAYLQLCCKWELWSWAEQIRLSLWMYKWVKWPPKAWILK